MIKIQKDILRNMKTIHLPDDLHYKLKLEAVKRKKKLNEFIEDILSDFIKKKLS